VCWRIVLYVPPIINARPSDFQTPEFCYKWLQQVLLNMIVQNKKIGLYIMHKYIRSTILEVLASGVVLYEAILQHLGHDSLVLQLWDFAIALGSSAHYWDNCHVVLSTWYRLQTANYLSLLCHRQLTDRWNFGWVVPQCLWNTEIPSVFFLSACLRNEDC
jgi:hypothetical protein